jgi:hypothetical protein
MKRPEPKGISKNASVVEKVKWAVRGAVKDTVKQSALLLNPTVKAGSAAVRIGDKVAQKVAETTKPGKLGTAGKEKFSKPVEPTKRTTVKDAAGKEKSGTYGGSRVEGTTPSRSMEQRIGDAKRQDTKRATLVESASKAGEKAAAPEVKKLADTGTQLATGTKLAAVAYVKGTQKDHYVTGRKDSTKKVKGD